MISDAAAFLLKEGATLLSWMRELQRTDWTRVPDLTAEQVARAEYLFITHSHRDHTGAIGYFESLGFAGSVLLTNQTYRQIKVSRGIR